MYKYRIEEMLNRKMYRDKMRAIHELSELLGITTNRLWRIRSAEAHSNIHASVEQLRIIARYLDTSVDELIRPPEGK